MKNLIDEIKKIVALSKQDEELIKSNYHIEKYTKKQIIENHGTKYNNLYFVKNGCIQLCLINNKGIEQTIQFSIKGWWLTDFDSFNYEKQSFYQLKAISNTEVYKFSRTNLNTLRIEIPELERYFRIVAERAYSAALYRISLMMNMSKEQRYFNYINNFPKFAKNVPQYILASYLGLSPEYLSEIRNKNTNIKPA
ncbi:Crp/Fnr family transcriptional regulator [uncultured Lacinutrix sp.]|uniref:Crp/Fnr family transcriptional regulator n=1 Tax=uncultured Lacinutrix sp. TaxID=574032 RepID=UPI002623F22B|nr:Crp/Fnr family transcriptional regulator [uncultured Lacinutrix sp.]